MTKQEHDKIAGYSQKHFSRIFGEKAKFSEKESVEFFYDAFAEKPADIYKAILQKIHEHYFRTIGKIQRSSKEVNSYEKKCNRCKVTFDSSNFYQLYDKRYEFKHLSSYCKKCSSEMSKENYPKYKHSYLKASKKYHDKNPEIKKISYEKNKEKQLALSYEKRRLSTEWWDSLSQEKQTKLLKKYNLKKPNRDAKLTAWRKEKYENT